MLFKRLFRRKVYSLLIDDRSFLGLLNLPTRAPYLLLKNTNAHEKFKDFHEH